MKHRAKISTINSPKLLGVTFRQHSGGKAKQVTSKAIGQPVVNYAAPMQGVTQIKKLQTSKNTTLRRCLQSIICTAKPLFYQLRSVFCWYTAIEDNPTDIY